MDERVLSAAACRGDIQSFNQLVSMHQDMAFSVAYRLLGHASPAADALEEALLAAYRALPALQSVPFGVWLLRRIVDACRRHARPDGCGAGEPAVAGCLGAKDGWRTAAQETPLDPDLVQAVESGIGSLPLESRVVLVLADMQGLSYEEVAQVTGASVSAVASRLGRARAQLACHLWEASVTTSHRRATGEPGNGPLLARR